MEIGPYSSSQRHHSGSEKRLCSFLVFGLAVCQCRRATRDFFFSVILVLHTYLVVTLFVSQLGLNFLSVFWAMDYE